MKERVAEIRKLVEDSAKFASHAISALGRLEADLEKFKVIWLDAKEKPAPVEAEPEEEEEEEVVEEETEETPVNLTINASLSFTDSDVVFENISTGFKVKKVNFIFINNFYTGNPTINGFNFINFSYMNIFK